MTQPLFFAIARSGQPGAPTLGIDIHAARYRQQDRQDLLDQRDRVAPEDVLQGLCRPRRPAAQLMQIAELAPKRIESRTALDVALHDGTNSSEQAACPALPSAAATDWRHTPLMVSA